MNTRSAPVRCLRVTGLVFCLSLILPALVFGLIYSFRAFGQTGDAQPLATPSPSASPSTSPSPTPITGLHQWGAVTLFHGLPSDRVRALAQTPDGAMWFGTETGLARFDGPRTQTINDPALPAGRTLALQTDKDGALWIGTEAGATRFHEGGFLKANETSGQSITAIATDPSGPVIMTSEQGRVFECHARVVVTTVNS